MNDRKIEYCTFTVDCKTLGTLGISLYSAHVYTNNCFCSLSHLFRYACREVWGDNSTCRLQLCNNQYLIHYRRSIVMVLVRRHPIKNWCGCHFSNHSCILMIKWWRVQSTKSGRNCLGRCNSFYCQRTTVHPCPDHHWPILTGPFTLLFSTDIATNIIIQMQQNPTHIINLQHLPHIITKIYFAQFFNTYINSSKKSITYLGLTKFFFFTPLPIQLHFLTIAIPPISLLFIGVLLSYCNPAVSFFGWF